MWEGKNIPTQCVEHQNLVIVKLYVEMGISLLVAIRSL
jgi:hypothetical protein